MKADLSRQTDRPDASYRRVILQQGRVQTDADFNEQQDITQRRVETETVDSLGPAAAPIDNAGFALTAAGGQVGIGAGRFYVDGLLCRNPAPCTAVTQPWLPRAASPVLPMPPMATAGQTLLAMPPPAAAAMGDIRVYDATGNAVLPADGLYIGVLEAWLRHVTALEDPLLREVALGGADTATREQLAWQVKLLRAGALGDSVSCLTAEPFASFSAPSAGRLAARAQPGVQADDPCELSPEAGYRRLDNQLYRVEVHDDGSVLGKARFKWQRDNGSIVSDVTRWLGEPNADEFEVATLGRDDVLAIATGCWVEFFDDRFDLLGRPGTLVRVVKTAGRIVTIDPASRIGPALDKAAFAQHPRVRRWDGVADLVPKAEAGNDGWAMLEGGVEVKFIAGRLRVGDAWTIPARTATADIEWPRDAGTGKPLFVLPQVVRRAFARLAVLRCAAGVWSLVPGSADCRPLFPALTELTQLHYVGGDGQQAMPATLAPVNVPLPAPLEVAVLNGQFPVAGARVRFTVSHGALPNGTLTQDVDTPASGIAAIVWAVSPAQQKQTASAELLVAGAPAPGRYAPVHFTATLAVAAQVAYQPGACDDLAGVATVQAALDALCLRKPPAGGCCRTVGKNGDFASFDNAVRQLLKAGERDICLCLLPGEQTLADTLAVEAPFGTRLAVHGAGPASRLLLGNAAITLTGFESVTFCDFEIWGLQRPTSVQLLNANELHLRDLGVRGIQDDKVGPMLVLQADVVIEGHGLQMTALSVAGLGRAFLTLALVPSLQPFFDQTLAVNQGACFRPMPPSVAAGFIAFTAAQRQTCGTEMAALQQRPEFLGWESADRALLTRVGDLVTRGGADPAALTQALTRLRTMFLTEQPGVALAVADVGADTLLADCRIDGHLVLGDPRRQTKLIDLAVLKNVNAQIATGATRLIEGRGNLRLRDNRLHALFVSDVLIDQINAAGANAKGDIGPLWKSCVAAGNAWSVDTLVQFMAGVVALTDNQFTKNIDNVDKARAFALASRGSYVGNVGRSTDLLVAGHTPDVFGQGLSVVVA